jgi:tetratricopeptide (TPR) repeat protein
LRKKALSRCLELVQLAPDTVLYQHQLAHTHMILSWEYRRTRNDPNQSRVHLTAAQDIYDGLIRKQVATPRHRLHAAECHAQLALWHTQRDEATEALQLFAKGNGLLEELVAMAFDVPTCKANLSTNLANMEWCYRFKKQWPEAFDAAVRSIALREELVRDYPQVSAYATLLKDARTRLTGLGNEYVAALIPPATSKASVDQLADLQQRLVLREKLVREYPHHADFTLILADSLVTMSRHQANLNQPAEAKLSLEKARSLAEQLMAMDPASSIYRNYLATILYLLANHNLTNHDHAVALSQIERSLTLHEELVAVDSKPLYRSNWGRALDIRARIYHALTRLADAEQGFHQAIDQQQQVLAQNPKDPQVRQRLWSHQLGLAAVYREQGRGADAVATTLECQKTVAGHATLLYEVALEFARIGPLLDKDSAARLQCIEHALTTLRQARAAGFADLQRLKAEAALAPLRELPEFQRLLGEWKTSR